MSETSGLAKVGGLAGVSYVEGSDLDLEKVLSRNNRALEVIRSAFRPALIGLVPMRVPKLWCVRAVSAPPFFPLSPSLSFFLSHSLSL